MCQNITTVPYLPVINTIYPFSSSCHILCNYKHCLFSTSYNVKLLKKSYHSNFHAAVSFTSYYLKEFFRIDGFQALHHALKPSLKKIILTEGQLLYKSTDHNTAAYHLFSEMIIQRSPTGLYSSSSTKIFGIE